MIKIKVIASCVAVMAASLSFGQSLTFDDNTLEVSGGVAVTKHFWIGMPDINADGCADIFVGSHVDSAASAMYLQDKTAGGECAATLSYSPNGTGLYSQAAPTNPRITSRFVFGDWYGDSEGMMSFWGHDVDSNPSARYKVNPASIAGGTPTYLPKSHGCYGWLSATVKSARNFCYPIDINGDGIVEQYVRSRLAGNETTIGQIIDINTGAKLIQPDAAGQAFCDMLIAVDANNDALPEIVNPCAGGYWQYSAGALNWQPGTFPALAGAGGNHFGVLDYDADGDDDVFILMGIYNANGFVRMRMYRNDGGSFSDQSASAGFADNLLYNKGYWTTYGNSRVADLDNNGYPDIIFASEIQSTHNATKTTVTLLMNNAGVYTIDRTKNFGSHLKYSGDASRPWVDAADYNNDGRIDIVKTHSGFSLGLFANTSSIGNYLKLHLRGSGTNTHGVGAKVCAKVAGLIVTCTTVLHDQLVPHLGLAANGVVDLEITWPGSLPVTYPTVTANAVYVLYESGELNSYTPGNIIARVAP
jgi:hypothetical protein